MAKEHRPETDEYLKVLLDRSELHLSEKPPVVFHEGPQSPQAKARYRRIKSAFEGGFLEDIVTDVKNNPTLGDVLQPGVAAELEGLVNSVSSERGRALVALTIMQLSIKAICSDQSVRLHKGGAWHDRNRFSWCEGLSMRSLDKNFVTPLLRKYDLIRLNADGFMMTRSLAENYPYSKFYKAVLRGGRTQWLKLTDLIELGKIEPVATLKVLVALLLNRRQEFSQLADRTLAILASKVKKVVDVGQVTNFMRNCVEASTYSARVFEISLHSLFQGLDDLKCLAHFLKPLSQMRSANKKHGNIGDIELISAPNSLEIIEAWDAKYGKPYLRDELEELAEKLGDHGETKVVGFVVDGHPNLKKEIEDRKTEIEELNDVMVHVCSFEDWVELMYERAEGATGEQIAKQWLTAFVESLCQKRRSMAPIDEPCEVWVAELHAQLMQWSP